jgi:hypothetical protein
MLIGLMERTAQVIKRLLLLFRLVHRMAPLATLMSAPMELGKESWLVAGIIPGVERQPIEEAPSR